MHGNWGAKGRLPKKYTFSFCPPPPRTMHTNLGNFFAFESVKIDLSNAKMKIFFCLEGFPQLISN